MHTGHIDWHGKTPSADTHATFDFYLSSRDPSGFVIPPSRFATGVWHLVLLEVTWSMTNTGSLRAWHQVQAEKTWTKTVEFRNIPTMQWGIGITGAIMSIDGIDGGGKPRKVSDKVGAYRYEGPNAVTYLNDGLLIGTTPNVVAPRLQGTPFSPVVLRSRPSAAVLGRPYRARLLETGGVAPLRWSVAGAFPPGLRLTGADGVIAGSATKAGSWPVTVTVRDALGAQSSRPVTLRVRR
jgi:Putative Ig domain